MWHLPVAAKNCGKGFICHANNTNTITISYGNHSHLYDFHTYVRSSPRLATLGPLELNMTQAEVDPNNKFLTNFVVMGFKSQNYGGHLRVFCNDVYTKKHLDFKFGRAQVTYTFLLLCPITLLYNVVFPVACSVG